ncbi:hypothetical protein CGCSCA1_v006082 [Colletotrichum siamense]|nr:hypothetical protein CGCSCA1_v006082 [Colletotrichum siamense]
MMTTRVSPGSFSFDSRPRNCRDCFFLALGQGRVHNDSLSTIGLPSLPALNFLPHPNAPISKWRALRKPTFYFLGSRLQPLLAEP